MGGCVICTESLASNPPPTNSRGQQDHKTHVAAIPCGHIYHATCIHTWLLKKERCPICQQRCPIHKLIYLYNEWDSDQQSQQQSETVISRKQLAIYDSALKRKEVLKIKLREARESSIQFQMQLNSKETERASLEIRVRALEIWKQKHLKNMENVEETSRQLARELNTLKNDAKKVNKGEHERKHDKKTPSPKLVVKQRGKSHLDPIMNDDVVAPRIRSEKNLLDLERTRKNLKRRLPSLVTGYDGCGGRKRIR